MQTIAVQEKTSGVFSIHEPTPGVALDCAPMTPTDLALWVHLKAALAQLGYLPLRRLGIAIQGNQVVLHGCVPSYYLKQLAQSALRGLLKDYDLVNLVEVRADQREH